MNASAVKRLSGKRMNMSDSAIRELNRMETAGGENGEQPEKIAVIDFKMVTFSLAGKDYAIDIMNVKEIAKAGRFTYVPNTAPFVLGVYNLRGDIIPIIDLRLFFNIPTSKREDDALESLIFIHVDEQTFGIVVDEIDKVVGISRNTIQPPHPIFGDINIKYIHGVVENQGRLYILLDVERIFSARVREEEAEALPEMEVTRAPLPDKKTSRAELDISFIRDGLAALAKFHVTAVNERWVSERYRGGVPSGRTKILSLRLPRTPSSIWRPSFPRIPVVCGETSSWTPLSPPFRTIRPSRFMYGMSAAERAMSPTVLPWRSVSGTPQAGSAFTQMTRTFCPYQTRPCSVPDVPKRPVTASTWFRALTDHGLSAKRFGKWFV